ncbi:MAG: hypothetical protein N2248_07820 [candidate division WOR-3 bacterium]|mgnify:CR=1 FL=1|uniref:T9SS type A sorting domain-containing protein n=1 Tax=candidate division WOR-3 bacterium TaxID=2052148 RepID=A0A7C1NA82_UNCW3|nr:hypothetical protein [candidate division WOR-3 bacterium]
MRRTVLALCLILGLAGIAPAQMNITGYVTTEAMPVEIDSVYFEFGSNRIWFTTPGWNANPGETTSFVFPEFAGWPAIIKMSFNTGGMPGYDSLYRPQSDSWYQLRPPNEQIRFMFHGEVGIQEQKPVPVYIGMNGILGYQQLLNFVTSGELELVNHLGQRVEPVNLAPGVYFYRSAGTREYHRFLLVR